MNETTATRVTLSFSPVDDAVVSALDTTRFRTYLRRAHDGRVAVGDEWSEFVSRGCGSTRDVTLRIESVDGGGVVGETTAFAFHPRE